jgi:hypothetical protein
MSQKIEQAKKLQFKAESQILINTLATCERVVRKTHVMMNSTQILLAVTLTAMSAQACIEPDRMQVFAHASQPRSTQSDAGEHDPIDGSDAESFEVVSDGPIENLLELSEGLFSGSEPKDAAAYEQLESLGVRTLISVDAIAPDAKLAADHNIQVIHLPIGYDGIEEQRLRELAYAIDSSTKPIFVHCHHGKHRGPSALVAGAIATGEIDHAQAKRFMIRAGTSEHYHGLWESVAQTVKFETIEPMQLRKRIRTGKMDLAMAEIDRAYSALWDCAENGFKAPDDHPDLSPISLASQIHDLLRALEPSKAVQRRGPYFHESLVDSINAASNLETMLKDQDLDGASTALELLEYSCVDCHSEHREGM